MMRKLGILVAIMAAMVVCLSVTAFAYTQEEVDGMTGPAFGIQGSEYVVDGVPGRITAKYGELVNATDNQDGTYTFEGKNFFIDSDWGEHCLTGYADSGYCTASGVMPTVYHTVSGPSYMLGKYCLIKGLRMRNGNKNAPYKTYDGIYKFEDTGGAAVEYGIPSTMNVPVVDIYRGTEEAARAVTDQGSIVAQIYILREIPQ